MFVRSAKNAELFREMEEAGELERTGVSGIYRVVGLTKLPFQIVITGELEGEEHAACRALTDRAREADVKRVIDWLEHEPDENIREYYGRYIVTEQLPICTDRRGSKLCRSVAVQP